MGSAAVPRGAGGGVGLGLVGGAGALLPPGQGRAQGAQGGAGVLQGVQSGD